MKPIRDPKTGAMVLPPQLFTSMKKSRVGLKGTYSLSLSLLFRVMRVHVLPDAACGSVDTLDALLWRGNVWEAAVVV